MPENEFEKKVSTELGGLKLKPSGEVWKKVEERIRKKKKKRVFIFIFLLAGLALFGWWQRGIFSSDNKKELTGTPATFNENKNGELITTEKPLDKKDVTGKNNNLPADKSDINAQEQITTASENENKLSVEIQRPDSKLSEATEIQTRQASATRKKKQPGTNADRINNDLVKKVVKENPEMEAESKLAKEAIKKVQTTEKQPENKQVAQEEKIVANEMKQVDPVKNETVFLESKEAANKDSLTLPPSINDSAAVSTVKITHVKKWKWGIEFTPGLSALKDQFLTLSFAKSAELISAPTGGAGAPQPQRPSKSTAGFAFQLSGYAIKPLTPRSSLSAGLRYAYYSDVIRIGNQRSNFSASLNQFLDAQGATSVYSAGDTVSFTNRYHFIELPVNYYFRLSKNETHPFSLQMGIKAGRLFSASTLVYDTVAYGIYYNSKKYLQKTQIGLTLGLNKTIYNKEKYQWNIGPVMDLHLNSLLDNPLEKKKYLLFLGLRSSVLFQRKK